MGDKQAMNIVMVMADDMGYWAMHCAGNTDIKTPNLDALARQGMRFTSFFCASPVCSPARASIMTGKIPSQHGVHDWITRGHVSTSDLSETLREKFTEDTTELPWQYHWPKSQLSDCEGVQYIDSYPTYTEILAKNGYTCALSGKWHLGDALHPQKGFTYWKVNAMGGDNYYYPIVKTGDSFEMLDHVYITDYTTDNALAFLDAELQSDKEDKPFYLSVHYTAPHAPWQREQHPAEFYDLYNDCAFTATPDVEPHPWASKYSAEQRRENLHGYYAAISAMDAGIGRIVECLKAKGIWEDTLFIFTSDNGMSMGHHGIFGKGNGTFPLNMYDTAVKVPMIMTYPGRIKPGTVNDGLYSHYDIMPTIAELLGEELPDRKSYPGQSFAGLINGALSVDANTARGTADAEGAPKGADAVVIADEYGPVRMIRTKEYKYIHRYPYGEHEFYDLTNDPDEERNLINESGPYAAAIAEMRNRLEDWFLCYTDPMKDGTKQAVTGLGQTGLVVPGSSEFIQR